MSRWNNLRNDLGNALGADLRKAPQRGAGSGEANDLRHWKVAAATEPVAASMSARTERSSLRTGQRQAAAGRLAIGFGFLLALGLGGAGCGKSGVTSELAAFKDTGHAVSEFSDADASGYGAKKCQNGTIDQLAVLLCEYGSNEAAVMGQTAAERWGGDTGTVVVLRRGSVLFAVADRNHADPNGKTISALAKVFRRVKSR